MVIKNALYIKLGEGGCWEKDSIENGKIRIGWKNVDIEYIRKGNWEKIKEIHESVVDRNSSVSSRDYNALKNIIEANDETVFITFFSNKMYWCIAKNGSIKEDEVSKYLETKVKWSDKSISDRRQFAIDNISGRLSKYRGYRGTVCAIGNKLNEFTYLYQIINNIETNEYKNLFEAKESLKKALVPAIKNLIPYDFEILVDLLFRNFGWKRISVLGETMKFFDIVLQEPLNKTLHGIQIKSKSNFNEYESYRKEFLENYQNGITSFFFVVHTPDKKLKNYVEDNDNIYIWTIEIIADFAIDSGLVNWIMDKTQ